MDSEAVSSKLTELLRKHRDWTVETLLPEEINAIITTALPSFPSSVRAQCLLFLSKFSSNVRQKYANSQPDSTAVVSTFLRNFSTPIEALLADTQEPSTIAALSFLTVLFQVDWEPASAIISRDGVLESVLEAIDIYPSSKGVPVAVANLISQASGHQQCRSLVSSPQIMSWLRKGTSQSSDPALRAAAAVAIVKLSQGARADAQESQLGNISTPSTTASSGGRDGADDDLVTLMKELVVTDSSPSSSILDAVEGLAYLTVRPAVKESISSDSTLLKRLVALVALRRSTTSTFPATHAERHTEPQMSHGDLGMSYGIAVIISNLCGYRPQLSEEEKQIDKLRRMTKEPAQGGKLSASNSEGFNVSETLDDDDHVRMRGRRLMNAGVVNALTAIIKGLGGSGSEKRSTLMQRTVAKSFLSLTEDKANRGMILQGGGAKSLLAIINASLSDMQRDQEDGQRSIDKLDPSDLIAIQALAKLSITSSPAAVFGPAKDSYVDAIRPFAVLLSHSSASLLQRFEALMALTNITSLSPDAAERVSSFRFTTTEQPPGGEPSSVRVGDIVKRAESLLLDGNTMVRRAATELVCNLVGGAEDSYHYFGGAAGAGPKSRLRILAALSDVVDLPTRLAASGALATITTSSVACQSLAQLEMEHHRLLNVIVDMISPEIAKEYRGDDHADGDDVEEDISVKQDPGLVHRGVICVRNIFASLDSQEERSAISKEADKQGLTRALIQVVKSNSGNAVTEPAVEVLRWIVQSGVKLPS